MKKIALTALIILASIESVFASDDIFYETLSKQVINATVCITMDTTFTDYYYHRLAIFVEEPAQSIDVLMLGDSLTENGGEWSSHFNRHEIKFLNRGINGDTTSGILYRLDEVKRHQPKKIFLLAGINDLANNVLPDTIAKNTIAILQELHKTLPHTQIYLQTLLPVDEGYNRYKGLRGKTSLVDQVNSRLKAIPTALPYITLIDLNPYFRENNSNTLKRSITRDGLHITPEGYLLWAEVIKGYID